MYCYLLLCAWYTFAFIGAMAHRVNYAFMPPKFLISNYYKIISVLIVRTYLYFIIGTYTTYQQLRIW